MNGTHSLPFSVGLLGLAFCPTAGSAQAIRGTVLGADGKPVVHARVCLAEQETVGLVRLAKVAPRAISRARTNSRGSFALDASRAVADTAHVVWIVTDEFADAKVPDLHPSGVPELQLGKIKLRSGKPIRGTVRDSTGKPIAGAWIRVFPKDTATPLSPDRLGGWTGRTTESGAYRIPHPCPGRVRVTAIYPGLTAVTKEIQGTAERQADFVLDELGRSVSGIVADANGTPIADTQIRIGPVGMPGKRTVSAPHPGVMAMTGNDGRFILHGLPLDSVELQARKPGYLAVVDHEVDSESETTLVTLPQSLAARLRVRTPKGESPAKYRVQLVHAGSPMNLTPFRIPAIHDGVAILRDLPKGTYRFDIRCKGFAQHFTKPFHLAHGGPVPEVEALLEEGHSLTGRIVDASGKPLADTEVVLTRRAGDNKTVPVAFLKLLTKGSRVPMAKLRTDASGSFRIDHLRPADYELNLHHPKHGKQELVVAIKPGEDNQLNAINLQAGVEITGIFEDKAGKPVGGARITVLNTGTRVSTELRCDAKGVFRLPRRARPGTYTVMGAPTTGNPIEMIKSFNTSKQTITVEEKDTEPVKLQLTGN